MSMKNTKTFIEKMKTDEAFRNRIMAIEDTHNRIESITIEGFECTMNDIQSLFFNCEAVLNQDPNKHQAGGLNTNVGHDCC